MNSCEYIKNAMRTESTDFAQVAERVSDRGTLRLLHAGIGMATEAGEFLDALKKHIYYGRELDAVNLQEEMGDLFWYMAIACDQLGVDFEKLTDTNIAKLKARYGEKFTGESAEARDLSGERNILEDKLGNNCC